MKPSVILPLFFLSITVACSAVLHAGDERVCVWDVRDAEIDLKNTYNGVVIGIKSGSPDGVKKLKAQGDRIAQGCCPTGIKGTVVQVNKLESGIEMVITADSEQAIEEVQSAGAKFVKGSVCPSEKKSKGMEKSMTQQPGKTESKQTAQPVPRAPGQE